MINKNSQVYKVHEEDAATYLTFKKLDQFPQLRHLFTTRSGGVSEGCCSSWNFGARELDSDANIHRNFEILAKVMGTDVSHMVLSQQTHTTNIRVVTQEDCGKGVVIPRDYTDIDGLITNERGIELITTHGDCNPIFFYDPIKEVIGLAHSGWKGTLDSIASEMASKMKTEFGCTLSDVIAGIGPGLCQECFEVDIDVAQKFFAMDHSYESFAYKKGIKFYLDLKGIIRHNLKEAGFKEENIVDMGLCTKCNNDIFFSHRGQHGKRGLMAATMMLR